MDIQGAIEKLAEVEQGAFTLDSDFKRACNMGKRALVLFAYDKALRLDDIGLELLLDAERKE